MSHRETVTPIVSDSPHSFNCGELLPTDDDSPRLGLCVDGSNCGRRATNIVQVAGTRVAACGGHVRVATEKSADIEDVELAGSDAPSYDGSMPSDPFDRSPDDYDVSDTLAALEGDEE